MSKTERITQQRDYDTLRQAVAIESVIAERQRQDEKWGQQNPPNGTGGPEHAVRANIVRERCEIAFAAGKGTWRHILEEEVFEAFAEEDVEVLREELVQVAAVTVAWIEALDRQNAEA